MEAMTYFSRCECGQELEGVGEFDRNANTLYGGNCPACGEEFTVLDWLDEEDEEN